MSYRELKSQVKQCVEAALNANRFPSIEIEPVEPPRPEFGDISVAVALNLAGRLKMKPLDVAERIVSKITIPEGSLIQKCWVHPPGYVNFSSIYPQYAKQTILNTLNDGANYGHVNIGNGARIGIEHTSVNPNKALHYGHLRNVVLGDSVRRLLSFAGYGAQTLNYIDDSGLQVADLIVGFRYAGFNPAPDAAEKFDHYCGDTVYVKVNELYVTRKDLVEAQKRVLREMEDHTSDTAQLASKITLRILGEQLKTCWRIGARYDLLNFESHILQTQMWNAVFEQLKTRSLVELAKEGKYAGCWIVRVEGEYEGEEKVIVRSDGTATYIAKDIPYAAWKLGLIPDRFGYRVFTEQPDGTNLWSTTVGKSEQNHPMFAPYNKAITVIDVRQGRLQRIIARILSNLAGDAQINRYIHLDYEIVSLSSKTVEELGLGEAGDKRIVSMSGRRGIYVNADDVLDAVHKKAYEETKKRNPDENEYWLHGTAEKIAVAAIRFELIKQDLDKTIVFDLERALDLNGETGPYLQYAYARAARILEKAGETLITELADNSSLTDSSEVALVKEISKFDVLIEEAVKNLAPKVIARYLYNIVSLFNTFYEKVPVLKEKNENLKAARLSLVKAFQVVVKNGLNLLGIETPERI